MNILLKFYSIAMGDSLIKFQQKTRKNHSFISFNENKAFFKQLLILLDND